MEGGERWRRAHTPVCVVVGGAVGMLGGVEDHSNMRDNETQENEHNTHCTYTRGGVRSVTRSRWKCNINTLKMKNIFENLKIKRFK